MREVIAQSLKGAISYPEYRKLVQNLLEEEKSTGPNQSEELLHYSKLNDKRMNRIEKTVHLTEELKQKLNKHEKPVTWLVITEGWCGDATQSLPIIHKSAIENDAIDLKIVLRDENEELMNLFLTNGSKSIPKLIVLNSSLEVLSVWGPRPTKATQMVKEYKQKHGSLDAIFKKELQIWYNKNKGLELQKDLIKLLEQSA